MTDTGDAETDFVGLGSDNRKTSLGDSVFAGMSSRISILMDFSVLIDSVSMLWYSSDGGGGGGGLGLGAGGGSMARVGGLYLGALGILFGRFLGDGIRDGDRIREGEDMLDED